MNSGLTIVNNFDPMEKSLLVMLVSLICFFIYYSQKDLIILKKSLIINFLNFINCVKKIHIK